jgi:hypothetical protein
MKKLVTILIFIIPICVFSQIDIRKDAVETTPVFKPVAYDSLKPFRISEEALRDLMKIGNTKENQIKELNKLFLKYVGQTIFFVPNPSLKAPLEQNEYSFINLNKKTKNPKETPYNKEYLGKYFKIVDVNYEFSDRLLRFIDLVLTDENNETVALRGKPFVWYAGRYPSFIIVGYFEKQKQKHVGKDFVFTLGVNDRYSSSKSTVDNITGEIVNLKIESEWKCTALEFIDLKDDWPLQLFLIFKNEKNDEIKVRLEKLARDKDPILISYFTEKQEYLKQKELEQLAKEEREKRLAEDAERKRLEKENWEKQMIQKYGSYHGNLIIKEQVVLGMSEEMCRQAWGNPININRTTVSGLVHEQWVYSMMNYLYFENGKLTAIQN